MNNMEGNIMTAGGDNNVNTSYHAGNIYGNAFNFIIAAKDGVADIVALLSSLVAGMLNPPNTDKTEKAEPSSPHPTQATPPSPTPPSESESSTLPVLGSASSISVPSKTNRFSGLSHSHLRRELFVAIKKNNVDDVRELLNRGVYINSLDVNQNTPLRVAVEADSAEIVDLLLTHPEVEVNDNKKNSYSALINAITGGSFDVVKSLLRHHSTDVNARGENGLTAIGIAAYYGCADIVGLLLKDPRVELNIEAENGLTLLGAAMEGGNKDVIELLKGRQP